MIVQARAASVPVLATPGGKVIGQITPSTVMGSFWTPVEIRRGGWLKVGLEGPPNGLSGWVRSGQVRSAVTTWLVVVSISHRTETVYNAGKKVAEAPVAVGAPATPTPTGHTFIDGDVSVTGAYTVEAPVLRPVALHSTSALAAQEIGGTLVALHGWLDQSSDPAVFGQAVSHGCVRAPAGPLTDALAQIPTGSPVWIEA